MNILLISPLLTKRKPVYFNIGLSYIASSLIEEGHDVSLLDIEAFKYSKEEVLEKIKSHNPQIIGIGTIVTGYKYVHWLSHEIKKILPNIPVILGNSIATSMPEIAINNLAVDYLVLGEGEITIKELVKAIETGSDPANVNGICLKKNDKIHFTPVRELISDLDSLPFPAWHLFPLKEISFKNKTSVLPSPHGVVVTTRGCPYKCTFCYHAYQNSKVRMHSPQRVVSELKFLIKTYDIKSFAFGDDLFVNNKKRVYEICDLIDSEGIKLKWRMACRVNFFNEELMTRLKKSGCIEIGIGIESGNQQILDNIKKQATVEQSKNALTICKKLGIIPYTSYMIGNVGETRETVKDSVEFIKKYDPRPGGFFIATPYPDTGLYNYGIEKGLIKDELKLIESYGEQSENILINFTNMSDNELLALKKEANKELVINYIFRFPFKGFLLVTKTILKKIFPN